MQKQLGAQNTSARRGRKTEESYSNWPLLPALFPKTFPGIFTARDQFLVDIEKANLLRRVEAYFDPELSHDEMKAISPQAMQIANRYQPIPIRDQLRKRGIEAAKIVQFAYRPFDQRWLYWEPETKLLNEKRAEYFGHVFDGNLWIAATQQNRKDFDPPAIPRRHATLHIIERGANLYPMLLKEWPESDKLFADEAKHARRLGDHFANLSDTALAYLETMKGVSDAPLLFRHAIAVLHAPAYAAENAAALRQDWPRVPLPATRAELVASAELGRRVAALLDPETPVNGVTAGKLRPDLKLIGLATKVGGGQLGGTDFAVTARWGVMGKGGVTMPSSGRNTERPFSREETTALGETGVQLLGPETVDVYLNDTAYWRNVPRRVWSNTLGGHQVLKKWLSYREQAILGRSLKVDEVGYVTQVARRIAALVLLGPELDENYLRVKANTYPFPNPAP